MQNETYFGVNFIKTKFDGLDGKTTVAFTQESDDPRPFQIRITKSGIKPCGDLAKEISTRAELEDLARLIADAWKEHSKLAPKIHTSLSGH